MGGAQTVGEKLREAYVSLRPGGALVRAALVAALWVVASAGQARPTQGRHCIDRRVEHVLFLSRANRHCPKALRRISSDACESSEEILRAHSASLLAKSAGPQDDMNARVSVRQQHRVRWQ